ncbi:hypothetical protein EYR36_005272 [Pleurotus pulmonarius]|nr:hypothetical protein EYR36_005272 [Pleurotus pulmonarius]
MSDQSPPPKPKPGSLRDRIAAFEKSSASAAPAPPPPRPKPGGVSWKPKPPSPPSSPKSSLDGEKKASGMSASDAKESIGKGVSLKERMAALQGKGGFGGPAPAPPTAPKPAVERPKWKPPPVVSPPAEEESDPVVSEPATADVAIEAQASPPIASEDASAPPAPSADEDEKDQEPVDPDEEERQRRAAITARIARLGGARVGMGPPIFGRPAVPAKKPSLPHEDPAEQKEAKDEEIAAKALGGAPNEPVQEHAIESPKEPHSVVSEEGSSSERLHPPEEVSPPRVPNSMPVPAVPRRAAPPRRKAKSPAPPLEEAASVPSITEGESPAATSDDVAAAAPAIVPEEQAAAREEHILESPPPPVDAHVEPVTAEPGPMGDLPDATPGTDDKEDGAPAVSNMDKTTPSIVDRDSAETIPYADAPKATLPSVETELEEPLAPTPTLEEFNIPNSPKEPRISSAEESTQPEVKAESPLQQPNLELREEEAEGQTGDDDVKAASPISQRASVDTIDDMPPPTVDLPSTPAPSDGLASPAAAPREEENPDPVVESTEEEEEAARRARVAARLAKMGAVNPFAPPPQRRLSHDVVSPPPTSGSTEPANASVTEASPISRSSPIAAERDEEVNVQKEVSIEHSETPSPALDTSKTQKGIEDDVPSNVAEDAKYPIDAPLHSLSDEHKASIESIHEPIVDPVEHAISDATDVDPSTEFTSSLNVISPPVQPSHPSEETTHPSHPPHPRRSLPPPRRVLPQSPDDVRDDAGVVVSPGGPTVPHPSTSRVEEPKRPTRLPPRTISDDEEEVGEVHPSHQSEGIHETSPRSNLPSSGIEQPPRVGTDGSHSRRSIPPIQTPHMQLAHDEPQTPSQASQPDEEALPTVLRFHPSSQDGDDEQSRPESRGSPIEGLQYDEVEVISPVPPPRSYQATHATSELPPIGMTSPNREILDEEEGDPIDPSFHSPVSPKSSRPNLRAESEAQEIEPSADDDQARRRTIAERMAKLGGIKLGGAPPLMRRPPPTPKVASDVPEEEEGRTPDEPPQEEDEEDEQARRQRILARLAGSGGMRLGMIPPSVSHHSIPQVTQTETEEEPAIPAPPPRHAAPNPNNEPPPPPPPPPHRVPHSTRSIPVPPVDTDSDSQSFSDAVQVEAEESELEEVRHEDADIPPPIPVRIGRHTSVESTSTMREQPSRKASLPPAHPTGRPPVPKVNLAMRRSSTDYSHQIHQAAVPQGDYVLVSDSMSDPEEVAPPPPPRHVAKHPAPPRGVPLPPAPPPDLGSSQWELPSIPAASIDFGEKEPDLSLSNWSEDSATFATSPPPTSVAHPEFVPVVGHQHLTDDHPRSSEELMMVWGRVGVQICEVATMLFEKSKKTLIGDGSYSGFIHAVLAEVPNAASPRGPLDFGSLIYMQTANAVQKRLAEIMPGDIILLEDVKLKGHKGLQIYHQNVGTDEPLIAVVNDFEAKKSKVKAFQANQHVGQQVRSALGSFPIAFVCLLVFYLVDR